MTMKKKHFLIRWRHEDNLINHRLTWLLISQTILITGYASIICNPVGEKSLHINLLIDCPL